MKRSGIYFSLILIFLSGIYLDGFTQTNDNIEELEKTYPSYDTIHDPVYDSVIIKIVLDSYSYWTNNPPDNIGFFSLNNNYSWVEKDVTNTTIFQPEYKSVSPVYLFDHEVNTVCFWLYDQENGHDFDSTRCFEFYYNKPQVELLDIDPAEKVTGKDIYVINTGNPDLHINAGSLFPSADVNSYITKIDIRKESSEIWENLWTNLSGDSSKDLITALPTAYTMEPGQTATFYLRAVGRSAAGYNGPTETSDEFPFTLTYMYIDFPDTICQVNSAVELYALPRGGNFTGNGILDNTSLFNPSLANANAFNKITYQYIIEGDEFSLDEDIYVIELPEVELSGELQVCANSTDAEYMILGAEPSKYDYIWEFTGVDEIIDSTETSVKVHWQANPASYTGMIRITLRGKNKTECPAVFEYLVDIDPDDAPDKPCVCLGDVSRRLLLCSNTTASYYRWYKSDGELIDSTETAYLYLTDDLVKYHDIDNLTTFYVSIANQLTGCYTRGDMCMEDKCAEATGINQIPGLKNAELSITVRNNPVHGDLVINASGNYSGPVTMQVSNMNGLQVKSSHFSKSAPEQDFKMILGSETAPGIYLMDCKYGNSRTTPVKLIVF